MVMPAYAQFTLVKISSDSFTNPEIQLLAARVQELLVVDSMPLWRPLLWSGKVALRLIVVDD
jgi:hypothetical protein